MQANIENAQTVIGYQFKNSHLLWEALQAPGSGALTHVLLPEGNKRLAGVGDAVIGLVIKLQCYERKMLIGDTTEQLKQVANNDHLASMCDANGLTNCVNGNPSQGRHIGDRLKANTVEAVVGAVYLDSSNDIEAVKRVMETLGLK